MLWSGCPGGISHRLVIPEGFSSFSNSGIHCALGALPETQLTLEVSSNIPFSLLLLRTCPRGSQSVGDTTHCTEGLAGQ